MNEENKKIEKSIKRHIDVLMENMQGNFKLLAEGQQILNRKIDVLTERVDVLTERVDVLTERMDVLTERVDVLTERIDVLSDRVSVLEEKVDLLVEDMDYVKSNLVDKTDKFKEVDKAVNDHEKRLASLEKTALASV